MSTSLQTGFESGVDEATRRALFDIQRRVSVVEDTIENLPPGGGGDGSSGFTYMQDAAPVGATEGQTWFETDTGLSYVWVVDANSSQWVQFAPGAGGGGGDPGTAAYVHHQGTSASVWDITHDLGWNPNITVIDSAGRTVEGDLIYLDALSLRLTFTGAFSGVAYLS